MDDKELQELVQRERVGGIRIISVLTIIITMIIIVGIWGVVYNIRSLQLDKQVEAMQPADTNTITGTVEMEEITTVRVVIDGEACSLKEFVELEEIPSVVDVVVYYTDENVVEKPAYISYADVEDVEYIDNVYGRIILPEAINK